MSEARADIESLIQWGQGRLHIGAVAICTQILGPEGHIVAQPDAGGFGASKQKPLKTGAQVALWLEETQIKMVEAVGVET